MRALNPRKMADDVRLNVVGKVEFAIYCIAFLAVLALVIPTLIGVSDLYTYTADWLVYADYVDLLLYLFGGLAIGYRANAVGDGKQFWYRYISVWFPITLIIIVLVLVLYGLGSLVGVLDFSSTVYGVGDLVLSIGTTLLSLYLTHIYMRRASQGSQTA